MKLEELRKHKAPLFHVYPAQGKAQPAYVEIRPFEDGRPPEVSAEWDAEIGGAVPFDVWHRRTLRFGVAPTVRGSVLADFLEREDVLALVARIGAGYSEEWDGSNYKGRLTEDAQDASTDLESQLGELGDESTCVAAWYVGDWLDAGTRGRGTDSTTIEGVGTIRTTTTDEELKAMAETLEKEADAQGIIFYDDVETWLRKLRDQATESEAYEVGLDDGAETARDRDAEILRDGGDPAEEMKPLTPETGATKWDADLINALGAEEAAKHLGIETLYADGEMTDDARRACADYNRGATDGWNLHVSNIRAQAAAKAGV